jgi:hypothetical protein
MRNYEEKIRFAMALTSVEWDGLKPGAKQDFVDELRAFIGMPRRDLADAALLRELPHLQQQLEQEFRLFASRNVRESKGSVESPTVRLFPSGDPRRPGLMWKYEDGDFFPRLPQNPAHVTVDLSSFRARFLWEVYVSLSKVDVRKVRACALCNRLFFADHGNQWFDSPKCGNRSRVERFREARGHQQRAA